MPPKRLLAMPPPGPGNKNKGAGKQATPGNPKNGAVRSSLTPSASVVVAQKQAASPVTNVPGSGNKKMSLAERIATMSAQKKAKEEVEKKVAQVAALASAVASSAGVAAQVPDAKLNFQNTLEESSVVQETDRAGSHSPSHRQRYKSSCC